MNKPKHISKRDWGEVASPPLSDRMLSRMKPVKETHSMKSTYLQARKELSSDNTVRRRPDIARK